ncbi:class II aldolase/adducin family protein [Candidatus Saganbacteria bacterium]|nr:class II aldolase/adducin family protein [Candidatus Saganbacteria bacterium]
MIEEFKRVGRMLFEEGLVGSHSGNLSIRQNDLIFITRSGAMLGDLKEGDVVEVALQSGVDDKNASVELPVHRAIYQGSSAQAIVHAHPANGTALSIIYEQKIIPQDAEGQFYFKSVPVLKVRQAIASDEVVKMLPPIFFGGYTIAMVRGHGSFAIGETLEKAYQLTSAFENSCRITNILKSIQPPPAAAPVHHPRPHERRHTGAIPPGIGVMGRTYNKRDERR